MALRVTFQNVEVLILAGVAPPVDEDISSTLNLIQTIDSNLLDEFLESNLNLQQSVHIFEPDVLLIQSNLNLTQSLDAGFVFDDLSSNLNLTQSIIDDVGGDLSILSTSTLELVQSIAITEDQGIATTLSLVQDIFELTIIESSLGLVHSIDLQTVSVLTQVMELDHSIGLSTIFSPTITHELNLQQSILAEILQDTCQYNPQVGSSDGEFTSPDITPPTLTDATLKLEYPHDTPTEELVLRNPQFGNLDTLAYMRINRDSRGGTALIFADPDWPKQEIFEFTINSLSQSKRNELEEFLELSLGQRIKLTDWEGRESIGVITNNPETTQTGRDCQYSIAIVFEKVEP
jgi:hypothetical protein